MPDYSIFGVGVRCNRILPGVPACADLSSPDVEIELAGMDDRSSMPARAVATARSSATPFSWHDDGASRYLLARYSGQEHEVIFCMTSDGTRMWCSWNDLVGIEDVTSLLLGPIFSCLLQLRGHTCLHAAVLAVNDGAIALIGAKGAGKSSTALALVQQGARLLSDDVAVLDEVAGRSFVRRGSTRLRVRPQTAAALGMNFDALPALWSQEAARPAKRYLEVRTDDADEAISLPLTAIYLLGERVPDADIALASVGAGAALPLLMAHRHMQEMLGKAEHARDFRRLAALTDRLPVIAVTRPEGVEHVHRIAESIRDWPRTRHR